MRPVFLTPDQVYDLTIDLWATSHVFLPGHRVRLEISSSNFPRFDRNLNTGEGEATSSRRQAAAQTILHDSGYPSHILPDDPKSALPLPPSADRGDGSQTRRWLAVPDDAGGAAGILAALSAKPAG